MRSGEPGWRAQVRLAFLTNMVPPYHKPLFKLLSHRYGGLRIFISTPMESNRPWIAEWKDLDVVVQKGLNFQRRWTHPGGFGEAVTIHFPLDTIPQLGRYKPDIIISGEMGARTLLALAYRRLSRSCKLLIWTEVTHITEKGRGRLRGLIRKLLARQADGFLALGAGGVDYIRSLGVAEGKIHRMAYTTDLEQFQRIDAARTEQAARRMLYVGQLVERKGLIPFLGSLAKWAAAHPERTVELVIAGDGPLAHELKAMITPRNVGLIFRGPLQYEELPDVYAQAGIFVLPTLADTWGVVVNEALASALPVLGSVNSQAVQEMVEEGKTGWTFRPERDQEVYGAIERAMACTLDELGEMRRRARQRALEITPEYVANLIDHALEATA